MAQKGLTSVGNGNGFTVVIVTYNRLKLLKQCIACVQNQSVKVSNIVIVNNNSNDGTREYLQKKLEGDVFHIITLKENVGGAGGFYYGLKFAMKLTGYWIVLIDDDAMLSIDFIEKSMNSMKQHPQYLAFAGVVVCNNELLTVCRRRIVNRYLYISKNVKKEEYLNPSFVCDLASFCGLIISKDIVRRIGYPCKEYFIWYDDTEYCCRINKYSQILNINDAYITHDEKVTNEKYSWKTYYGRRNEIDLVKRHFSNLAVVFIIVRDLKRLVFALIHAILLKDYKNFGFVFRIFMDAIMHGSRGKLGKNKQYLPLNS